MASSTYFSFETYRHGDPIENLQLQVTLRKRGGSSDARRERGPGDAGDPITPRTLSRARSRDRLRRGKAAGASGDDDDDQPSDGEEEGSAAQREQRPLKEAEEEEDDRLVCPPRTFRWQEKVFGPMEVEAIRKEGEAHRPRRRSSFSIGRSNSAASTLPTLSNHHREVFARLERESEERGEDYKGETLFTRVHSEEFYDPTDLGARFTDSLGESTTQLARAVTSGTFVRQHRDMLGEAASIGMHVLAALPEAELDTVGEAGKSSAASRKTTATASTPTGEVPLREVLLCTLRLFPGGRLDVKPPFSVEPKSPGDDPNEEKLARWYAVPGTRFEFMLENLAETLGGKAAEYEAAAERVAKLSLSAQTRVNRSSLELDFSVPPRRSARVHYMIELESASGFGPSSLYIVYYALAAPGWRLLPHCTASAITQTSRVRGREQRAVLGFPIDISVESDGPPTEARPPLSLFLSICSRDMHERMTQLGYAHVAAPATAGMAVEDVGAWRLAEDRVDALRRFFVGGAEELRDLRALAIPESFDVSKPQCLNKHGLRTVSTGSVRVKINTIVQQQQPAATPAAAAKAGAAAKGGAAAGKRGEPVRRSAPELGSLKGVLGVNTLARSETAHDRVRKRYEERQRAAANLAP
jgi:Meckel syndrome type 1 protein